MEEFKIGDRVKRINTDNSIMRKGDTGVVTEIDGYGYIVKIDNTSITEYQSGLNIELIETINEDKEQNIKELADILKNLKSTRSEKEIERIKDRIGDISYDIKSCNRSLARLYKEQKKLMVKVEYLNKINNETDFTNDLELIKNNKYVEKINISKENTKVIKITTDYIDIYDNEGNKFRGNKYMLEFDYNNMGCLIRGLDDDYNRESWWANNRKGCDDEHILDPHPHVDGLTGEACWGEAGPMLSSSMNEYEIYASFVIVLNFLQQVNTEDAAGKFIRNWDCVNENDEDIDNPYDIEIVQCHICGDELEEDEVEYCNDCGKPMCSYHSMYVNTEGYSVCETCYEEDYVTCYSCDDVIKYEDAMRCDNCDEWFCEDCYIEVEGDILCKKCESETTDTCDNCGGRYYEDNLFECEECNGMFCINCSEENVHNNRILCDDCYEEREDMEEEEDEC